MAWRCASSALAGVLPSWVSPSSARRTQRLLGLDAVKGLHCGLPDPACLFNISLLAQGEAPLVKPLGFAERCGGSRLVRALS